MRHHQSAAFLFAAALTLDCGLRSNLPEAIDHEWPDVADRRRPRTAASQMQNVKDPGRSSDSFGARRWAGMGRQAPVGRAISPPDS
jgi:hypothetical protein